MTSNRAYSDESPEPLLPLVARGEAGAVNECVRRYGPLVWSLARRMSGTRADAEDAAQEVFMHLWRTAGSFDPARSSERTFITLLARRKLIDRLRRDAPRTRNEVPVDSEVIDGFEAGPALAADPDAQRAARLIASLPDDRREIVVMSLADGWSHSEISERTGVPLGTVKSTVRRSLLQIREQLGLNPDGRLPEGGAP